MQYQYQIKTKYTSNGGQDEVIMFYNTNDIDVAEKKMKELAKSKIKSAKIQLINNKVISEVDL